MLQNEQLAIFNDYDLPASKMELARYLSNYSIYNLKNNLGSMRMNFGIEILPLLFIYFLSFFVSYGLAGKLFYVIGFLLIEVTFFWLFKKISGDKVSSFFLALLTVFNLWSFDRLQQGHYFNLMLFLPVAGLFVYHLYYSKSEKSHLILPPLLFLGMITYYHYTFILFYLLGVDFLYKFITEKKKKKLLIDYFQTGLITVGLMMMFFWPYLSVSDDFINLAKNVSSVDSIKLFSWQSTLLSTFFHLRRGMASYFTLNTLSLISYLMGMGILYFLWFRWGRKSYFAQRLNIAILVLFFLSFGIWIFPNFIIDFVYKIPTMSTFRDMNKFVGIAFILILFVISTIKEKRAKYIIVVGSLLIVLPVVFNDFKLVPERKISFHNALKDGDDLFAVISFPSYSIFQIESNGYNYHGYLPSLSVVNNLRFVGIGFPYDTSFATVTKNKFFENIYKNWNWLSTKGVYEKFKKYGIKYIYFYKKIPFDGYDEIRHWYQEIDIFKKIDKKQIVYEDDLSVVFQVPDEFLRPMIFLDKGGEVGFDLVNDTKINLKLHLKKTQILHFLSNYHQGWGLYLGGVEILRDKHRLSDGWANSWVINPEYIKENFPKKYYQENSDGSIDVDLILYFKPQLNFYRGLLISGLVFIGWLWWYLFYRLSYSSQVINDEIS